MVVATMALETRANAPAPAELIDPCRCGRPADRWLVEQVDMGLDPRDFDAIARLAPATLRPAVRLACSSCDDGEWDGVYLVADLCADAALAAELAAILAGGR